MLLTGDAKRHDEAGCADECAKVAEWATSISLRAASVLSARAVPTRTVSSNPKHRSTMKTLRLFSVALLATCGALFASAAERPEVGRPAPDFTLTDSHGKTHSLSSFKGKVVVLEWINHGCPFVVKHYDSGNMPRTQRAAAADGVVWLSICSSAPGKQGHLSAADWNKTNAEKGAAPAAVLLDEAGAVGRLYHATNTPQLFVIDATGVVVYSGAIDSIPSAKADDVPKATNYILAALAALKAGRPVATSVTKPYGCSVKYAD